ncbi:dTDP-4-dehydrorhamnose reductase [Salinibacter sp. 10B]|uniref:dTDP-4-dehydrorhamnose reductase n=1 Tax=Salinibacter sp. 10B TaxID=1923971 RepID=UPI000CF3F599|nr:dTDP-4-dehydrorhamnose reductase [Salinibacter sp. 10B]
MSIPKDSTLLLLGGTGQVGHELRAPLARIGSVAAPGREQTDLTDPSSLRAAVREIEPDVIVNAAAYTAVDQAEQEVESARVLNAEAPRVLSEAAAKVGAWLVHYSTDYVFDGTHTAPYEETDAPNPINVYGRTKRAGEEAIQDVGGRHLILRTSWVYSDRRSNFLRTMLRLADENDTLTVVDDQTGTPTWAGWIAEATATMLRHVQAREAPREASGLYHLAASGQTSWYGFARAIFSTFGCDDVTVEPVSSDEYPTAAARPKYTVLDSGRARETFDLTIPTWTEQLAGLRERTSQQGGRASGV